MYLIYDVNKACKDAPTADCRFCSPISPERNNFRMDRLNMSLDDLIAAKQTAAKNNSNANKKNNAKSGAVRGGASQKQPVRAAPYAERPRKTEQSVRLNMPGAPAVLVMSNVQTSAPKQMSVFARLGKPPVSGTRVTFSNLKSSVRENDVRELCAALGEIKEIDFTVGRSGKNSAIVLFARRSDALTCVTNLNGMTLDGFAMEVAVTGEPAEISHPQSVFDRLQGVPAAKNVRSGLFGTAMGSDDNEAAAPFASSKGGPSFSVSLSNDHGRTKLIQPFHVQDASASGSSQNNRPRSSSNAGRFNQHDDRVVAEEAGGRPFSARGAGRQQGGRGGSSSNHNNIRGNGGAGGAPRGRGGAGGQGKPAAASANPKDLDADLDAYFAAK